MTKTVRDFAEAVAPYFEGLPHCRGVMWDRLSDDELCMDRAMVVPIDFDGEYCQVTVSGLHVSRNSEKYAWERMVRARVKNAKTIMAINTKHDDLRASLIGGVAA